jgi:hypothetical protein
MKQTYTHETDVYTLCYYSKRVHIGHLGLLHVINDSVYKISLTTIGQSVKLLLAFASTVISGFSLQIHEHDFCSLLDMYVFRNGASSTTEEGSVYLYRRYVCCTVASARVYPRCHGVQVTMDSVLLQYTK